MGVPVCILSDVGSHFLMGLDGRRLALLRVDAGEVVKRQPATGARVRKFRFLFTCKDWQHRECRTPSALQALLCAVCRRCARQAC